MISGIRFVFISALSIGLATGCGQPAGTPSDGTSANNPAATPEEQADASHSDGQDSAAHGKQTNDDAATGEITLVSADLAEYEKVIAKHKGKVVLVDFWALWCIPCVKNFHHTVEWSQKYKKDGFVAVSVSLDDPEEDQSRTLNKLKEFNAQFDNLISTYGTEEAFIKFQLGGALPHYKIYDRSGKLVKDLVYGDIKDPEPHLTVELAIQEALKQK